MLTTKPLCIPRSVLLLSTLLLTAGIAQATSIKFAWDAAATGATPTGYRLCAGTTAGTYPTCTNVGLVLTGTVDLDTTKTNFIIVRAYNTGGESPNSNEVTLPAISTKPEPPLNLRLQP
jgi:hypothetical protein